tara:strand:+ start:770 stop:2098 length:1329 start_codon:yes stop_codon:yes gene_type:complete
MATDGQKKWERYFYDGDKDTVISAQKTGSVAVLDDNNRPIDTLKHGHPITVPKAKEYNAKYAITYKKNGQKFMGRVPQKAVSKPITRKEQFQKLNIDVANLMNDANVPRKDIFIAGKPVRSFILTTSKDIAAATMRGLKKNPNVNEKIIEVMENYFAQTDPTTINWGTEIPRSHIDELGVFIGEILIGYIAFKNGGKKSIVPNIITKKPKVFVLPDDPSFPGIDSLIELNDGTMVPISSKFGVGAKASFFSNLLPKAMNTIGNIKPSTILKIAKVTNKLGLTADNLEKKKGAKDILYHFGVNEILGIKTDKALDIFQDINKNGKTQKFKNPLTMKVLLAIQNQKGLDPRIKKGLPFSVTAFFSRTIAAMLMANKPSMDEMKRILSGKNFWQANLNITVWRKGNILFKMTTTKKVELKIIGSKSSIDDISGKQGMLNYELQAR